MKASCIFFVFSKINPPYISTEYTPRNLMMKSSLSMDIMIKRKANVHLKFEIKDNGHRQKTQTEIQSCIKREGKEE